MKTLLYFRNIRNYINNLYDGRIGRKSYFLGLLFLLLAVFIAIPLSITLGVLLPSGSFLSIAFAIIGLIISCCAFFAYVMYVFSLHVRRLHDTGNSGWWILLGPLAVLFNLFKKGEENTNKYGDLPAKDSKFFRTIFNLER